jgi:hypothetical protein
MAESNEEYLGIMQYIGPSVDAGYLDAKKSAEALLGLDEALRYFVGCQSAEMAEAEYEIPVRIRKGSWEALIPADIESWVRTAAGIAAAAYVAKAAQTMAANDFQDVGLRQVFAKAMQAIQWAIRIGKHLGTLTKRTFENARFRGSDVGIPNEAGEMLYVPKEFVDLFERMPANLLVKMTSVVSEERTLRVVVQGDDEASSEAVDVEHKHVFCPEKSTILFPELSHGDGFDEVGLVTRGNENTNTMGFLYEGHILTCMPDEGSIVRFKSALFLPSRMAGWVTREDKFGEINEPRPKVIFTRLEPVEPAEDDGGTQQPSFFDDEG